VTVTILQQVTGVKVLAFQRSQFTLFLLAVGNFRKLKHVRQLAKNRVPVVSFFFPENADSALIEAFGDFLLAAFFLRLLLLHRNLPKKTVTSLTGLF